ncbi:prion-inhibition and propagation-domain-containing protein [Collybia nuda]|uniref:Prion-inhibition and propagation-domain-containing protein n=1 Tax=Collybia nuda TaxID=64659 RepID=A0A9P5XY84_9AGAR|nr:prion-inhibition and propagation-domain-containing protein [Collybia nuda]
MEFSGLFIGPMNLVALWNSCIEVFDVVEPMQNSGPDEVLRVKLEVERVRLIVWGEMMGMNTVIVDKEGTVKSHAVDPRLNEQEVKATVNYLLGCIDNTFKSTDALKKRYGLKKGSSLGRAFNRMSSLGRSTDTSIADRTPLMLESVFPPAYATLQHLTNENKRSTSSTKKAKWSINDKMKFQNLVKDMNGYNNSLINLFPDIGTRAAARIKEDIGASNDVRRLRLVREAASEIHKDMSTAADVRLSGLGAALLSSPPQVAPLAVTVKPVIAPIPPKPSGSSTAAGEMSAEETLDPALVELQKAMDDLEGFCNKKEQGSIVCQISGPTNWSSRCHARIYWAGEDYDQSSSWNEESKGYVSLPHSALNLYHRKKYIKKIRHDKYNTPTDEDYIYLDAESDPKYNHVIAGTVTVEGFGLDCWDYHNTFGKHHEQTILVSYADLPDLPAKKILRRLDELRKGAGRLGWDLKMDYMDLKEFTGDGGITWVDPNEVYKHSNQISNLYSLLNRRDIFANFLQDSSIGGMVLGALPDSPGMWNVLWQIILGKELARRLDNFPDMSMSGFTSKILTTLIASDLWMSNVRIELAPLEKGLEEESVVSGKDKAPPPAEKEETNAWDEAYSLDGKSVQIHSTVHERQVEGLIRFAELMRWPFINETRDFAEDVYANLRGGTTVPIDLWDWLFGLVLPGKWASFKVMAALVLSTPSLTEKLGVSVYFDGGLSLPKQSYWRCRTVLGRVLSSLPGVKSLCGWVGPCPAIEGPQMKYIRLKARRVAPPVTDNVIHIGGYGSDDGEESTRPKKDEDIQAYISQIKDESSWSTPAPPVLLTNTFTFESIHLKALPLEADIAANSSTLSQEKLDRETEYRASLTFQTGNGALTTYTLYTNPVFVSAPPCHNGPHKVHSRELSKFRRNIWNVQDLKDAAPDGYETKDLLVINATGRGAETLAKAWCSEKGKNALIRTNAGPCYTCAYNAASKGLRLGVLIWVS